MTLDFPACPTQEETPPPEMLSALGIRHYVAARKGRARLIVLDNRQQVEALAPRFSAMTPGEHKVSVTARGEGNTILSAAFSPRGIRSGRPGHRLRAHDADPILG